MTDSASPEYGQEPLEEEEPDPAARPTPPDEPNAEADDEDWVLPAYVPSPVCDLCGSLVKECMAKKGAPECMILHPRVADLARKSKLSP